LGRPPVKGKQLQQAVLSRHQRPWVTLVTRTIFRKMQINRAADQLSLVQKRASKTVIRDLEAHMMMIEDMMIKGEMITGGITIVGMIIDISRIPIIPGTETIIDVMIVTMEIATMIIGMEEVMAGGTVTGVVVMVTDKEIIEIIMEEDTTVEMTGEITVEANVVGEVITAGVDMVVIINCRLVWFCKGISPLHTFSCD
jgi:hypothetical protein